jgi:SAM-dependent methyltransferase
MLDYLAGDYDGSFYYVRGDGHASPFNIASRFAQLEEFSGFERTTCALARGRVLDVGCGSGKHVVALRELGHDCIGIDNSWIIEEIWRRQSIEGVQLMDAFDLHFDPASFDTVTLFANGISMAGNLMKMRQLLAGLAQVTNDNGRVVATNVDPARSLHEYDRAYHRANEAAQLLPGRMILHCRYRGVDGPPFPWLLLSAETLSEALDSTAWHMAEVHQEADGTYVAVLTKRPTAD